MEAEGRLNLICCSIDAADGRLRGLGGPCVEVARLLEEFARFCAYGDGVERVPVTLSACRGRLRINCLEVNADEGYVIAPRCTLCRGIELHDYIARAVEVLLNLAC